MRFLVLTSTYFMVFTTVLGGFVSDVRAQDARYPVITQEDLEKNMFESNVGGCRTKLEMYVVGLSGYQDGEAAGELSKFKIAEAFVQKEYDFIRANGVSGSKFLAMQNFQGCIESFEEKKSDKNKSVIQEDDEALMTAQEKQDAFISSCGGINALVLSTLEGINRGYKQDAMIAKARNFSLDTSDTMLEEMKNPEEYVVTQIYGAGGGDPSIDKGFQFVLSCLGTKR